MMWHFRIEQTSRERAAYRPFLARVFTAALILLGSMPLYSNAADRPDFEGAWLGSLITFDDSRWRIEDLLSATQRMLMVIGLI